MRILITVAALAAMTAASGLADAQTSRAGQQREQINRSIQQQQQNLRQTQQRRFETNQMRMHQPTARPIRPGRIGCPASSVTC